MKRSTPIIVGLGGLMGSGKSAIASSLVFRSKASAIIPFAMPIKRMMLQLGVNPANVYVSSRKEEPLDILCGKSAREAMQLLGTEWGRNMIGQDVWVNAWRAAVETELAVSNYALIIADDLRFDNEAVAIRQFGGIVLRVERNGVGWGTSDPHASERLDYDADAVVTNNGTLQEAVAQVEKHIGAHVRTNVGVV